MFIAIQTLEKTGTLSSDYHPHKLEGKSKKEETWDGHIEPDWVLLWQVKCSEDIHFNGIIVLIRTGTHSDLFK